MATSRGYQTAPIPPDQRTDTKTRARPRTGPPAIYTTKAVLGLEPILVISRNRMELCLPATFVLIATTIQPRLVPEGVLDHSTSENDIDLVLLGSI